MPDHWSFGAPPRVLQVSGETLAAPAGTLVATPYVGYGW
jgi:hypothetical protein